MPRCQGTTKTGSWCKLPALKGEEFCRHHLPAYTTLEDSQEARSLGQRIAAIVHRILVYTRYQLIIVGLAFAVTFVFSRDNNYLAAYIEIPHEIIIRFFSALSQALGALLGLLIAFLIFRMQGADQEIVSAYHEFKSEMRRLVHLAMDRPDALAILDDDLALVIRSFAYLRMEHLPIQSQDWVETTSGVMEKWLKLNEKMPRAIQLYFEQIILVLSNIEDSTSRLGVQLIHVVIMRLTVDAIAKLSLLLGTSLILLLAFGTIDRQGVFPELRLPTVFAIVIWLLIALYELLAMTRRLYRDFQGQWEIPGK
jgi:hypothetical protein